MIGGDMVIDIQSPEVGEVQQVSTRWPDSCKPETVCDTTSDNVGSVASPMTSLKTGCDVTGMAGNSRIVVRRPGSKMATNSTSVGRRRNNGGSVRIEERRFRCAECFKAFKFKHHLQVSSCNSACDNCTPSHEVSSRWV